MFTSFGDAPALQEFRYITTSIGVEYYLYNILGVRMGYFYEHPTAGGRQFITLGISGKYSIASLAFSTFISTNPQSPLYGITTIGNTGINNPATKASFFITLMFDFIKGGVLKNQPVKKLIPKQFDYRCSRSQCNVTCNINNPFSPVIFASRKLLL